MVFPVSDDNTGRTRTPYVTYVLIALNVLVFVFLQGMGTNEQFTYAFSVVPEEIRTGEDIARQVRVQVGDDSASIPLQPTPGHVYLTLLISMFMHGSFMHLFGNMLFLWIFGDNVEDDLGPGRFTWVLSGDRAARVACARRDDVHARGQPLHPEPWRVGSHFRGARRVSRPAPASARARPDVAHADGGARVCGRRFVVRLPAD